MGLAHPVSSKVLTRSGSPQFKVGAASMQGFRNGTESLEKTILAFVDFVEGMRAPSKEMEDAHTIELAMKKHTKKAFFGVYDGHNGDVCAHWSAEHLWQYVDKLDEFNSATLKKACLEADKEFLTSDPESLRGGLGGGSGCTAVFVVVDTPEEGAGQTYKLTIANIGDSRALLCRAGETVALTEDHKPTNEIERSRIVAAGGFVQAARVDGQLALSRAMGDSQYKGNAEIPDDEQKVIAVPDVTTETMGPNDFLLICCDGIFESFTNEEAVDFVKEKMKTHGEDPAMIMALLLDAVLHAGSKDNMTALLILPTDGTAYHQAKDEFLPGSFHEHRTNASFTEAYARDARQHGVTLEEAVALLDKNAESGYYKPVAMQARGINFMNLVASVANGGLRDDDDDDGSA